MEIQIPEEILNKVYPDAVPTRSLVGRAFELCHDPCIVILGQDPYPQPNIANGIAFSNNLGIEMSPSLEVLWKELNRTHGISQEAFEKKQNLEHWCGQGILLLNSALTCRPGQAGSHVHHWRNFIHQTLAELSFMTNRLYVLLGKKAQEFKSAIHSGNILEYAHPAADTYGGKKRFEGCGMFLEIDKYFKINWI